MLSGQRYGLTCLIGSMRHAWNRVHCPKIVPQLRLALDRLGGFAFVGLTDRWNDSICLFHARFGGRCLAAELLNNRPTAYPTSLVRNSTQIDADAALAAFHDRYDSVLYRAVRSRFEREWRELALSPQRCRQICPEAAA